MSKKSEEILTFIKSELSKQKSNGAKNCTIKLEVYMCPNGICVTSNRISDYFAEDLGEYQFTELNKELIKGLEELKLLKGWNSLVWDTDEINAATSLYYNSYVSYPKTISLLPKPCKEFLSLSKYLEKYCGKKLEMQDIYGVVIGGKRGRVYGEDSNRYYLAHSPNKCSNLLEELRKCRGTKDIISISQIKQEDDIDEWDLKVSINNETEFSGVRHKLCEVTIKTPNGKMKKTIRIAI